MQQSRRWLSFLSEFFYRQHARQSTKLTIRTTYRKYAEPLAFSSTDLFWRLREVFDPDGGGFYLKGTQHLTVYEHYKAMSTLYRMANLLGWVRALHRELFFIPGSDPTEVEELDGALRSYGTSLAEGRHVEEQRVAAFYATAKIIDALHSVDPDQSRISTQTRNAVAELLNLASAS